MSQVSQLRSWFATLSKHIVIFASRKIITGEELTYDDKFPIEEVKSPCNCQSMRCRKYLN